MIIDIIVVVVVFAVGFGNGVRFAHRSRRLDDQIDSWLPDHPRDCVDPRCTDPKPHPYNRHDIGRP